MKKCVARSFGSVKVGVEVLGDPSRYNRSLGTWTGCEIGNSIT